MWPAKSQWAIFSQAKPTPFWGQPCSVRRFRPLTDIIVGLADIVIPDGDVEGFLGQVAVLDVVEKLLSQAQRRNQHQKPKSQISEDWGPWEGGPAETPFPAVPKLPPHFQCP